MKKLIALLPVVFASTVFAEQSCNDFPQHPELLTETEIELSNVSELDTAFERYLSDVSEFSACLDGKFNSLDYEADGAEQTASAYRELSEKLEQSKSLAFERYNYIVANAQEKPMGTDAE